jgi:hypothetical protein
MGDIYKRADTVLVWLGEPDKEVMISFDQIRILGESGNSSAQSTKPVRSKNPCSLLLPVHIRIDLL